MDTQPMPLAIQPPTDTPSLWFFTDGVAYRLDEGGVLTNMGPRHRRLARALLDFALDNEEA